MGILQHKPRTFGGHASQVAVRSVVQVRKDSSIRNPSAHPVYSITNSKTRLEMGMALMGMRITSLPVFANLHYNTGVGTFLLRIWCQKSSPSGRSKAPTATITRKKSVTVYTFIVTSATQIFSVRQRKLAMQRS